MQAITGAASVFAIFVQSTGDVCRRQARLRVTDAGWKAVTPLLAKLECHRRRRLDLFTGSVVRELTRLPEKGDVRHAEIGCHHLPLFPRNGDPRRDLNP